MTRRLIPRACPSSRQYLQPEKQHPAYVLLSGITGQVVFVALD